MNGITGLLRWDLRRFYVREIPLSRIRHWGFNNKRIIPIIGSHFDLPRLSLLPR